MLVVRPLACHHKDALPVSKAHHYEFDLSGCLRQNIYLRQWKKFASHTLVYKALKRRMTVLDSLPVGNAVQIKTSRFNASIEH
jgi:hypothetical protein